MRFLNRILILAILALLRLRSINRNNTNPVTPPYEPEKSGANDEGGNDAPNKEEDMDYGLKV